LADTHALMTEMLGRLEAKNPAALKQADGVYQFHLTGEDGGEWALVIQDGTPRVETGNLPDAGVTVTMTAADFKDLVAGRLNAMTAFMSGKLQVNGNMGLAMKLSSLI
jgi:putative sterol carrier protein